ncbi:hypothetical protein YC2023_123140 [Brassica napus]
MSAAFHREPPHHFCLDYHRRTTHRYTETTPEHFDSTPSSPRPPILPIKPNLGENQSWPRSHPPQFNTGPKSRGLRSNKRSSTREHPSSSDEGSANKTRANNT